MYKTSSSCQINNLSNLYLEKFGYKNNGTFVEVGASDGYYSSNTYGLIEAGWNGLCIEPNIYSYELLVKRYKDNNNIKTLQFGIGKEGKANLVMAGALSTTSTEQYNKYKELAWLPTIEGEITIDMHPLDAVLLENNIHKNFEVLVVDTEGTEYDVLKTFSIDKWMPTMCIVEVHENHQYHIGNNVKEINDYFEVAGYDKIYSDQINNIYTIKEN